MKSGNGMAGTGTSPWRCWPTPAWRWSGARRRNKEVREKRGLSQLGRKADTPDGARGPAVALPADMETSTYGRISAVVVPVETAAPGNGPALPLPTPPETPHHISATVVLGVETPLKDRCVYSQHRQLLRHTGAGSFVVSSAVGDNQRILRWICRGPFGNLVGQLIAGTGADVQDDRRY